MTRAIWSAEPSRPRETRADERNLPGDGDEPDALAMEEALWQSAEGMEAAEAPLPLVSEAP